MNARSVNGKPDLKPKHCPRCEQVMLVGCVVLISGAVAGTAYICSACGVIYLPKFNPPIRFPEGMN